jgi:hypothetical protein
MSVLTNQEKKASKTHCGLALFGDGIQTADHGVSYWLDLTVVSYDQWRKGKL